MTDDSGTGGAPSASAPVPPPSAVDSLDPTFGAGSGLISTEEFRIGLEFFLLNFTPGSGEATYKDQIRRLALNPFANFSLGEVDKAAAANDEGTDLQVPTVALRLEHLQLTHWLPPSCEGDEPGGVHRRSDRRGSTWSLIGDAGSSARQQQPQQLGGRPANELRRICEGLYTALTTMPFKYLTVAEVVVRDVFVLLEWATRSAVATTAGNESVSGSVGLLGSGSGSSDNLPADLLEAAKKKGAAKLLENIEGAKALKQNLLPFQVELVHREGAQRIRDLSAGLIERLVVVPGIVVQTSKPTMKASILQLKCQKCGHRKVMRLPQWKQGVALPRVCDGKSADASAAGQAAGAGQGGTGAPADRCPLDPFVVVGEDCHYIDQQTVKIQELPDDVPTGDMPRHLMLNVTSVMVGRMTAGSRILVCGVYSAFDRGAGGAGNQNSRAAVAGDKAIRSGYLHVLGMELLDRYLVSGMASKSTAGNSSFAIPGTIGRSLCMTAGTGFSSQQVDQFHRLATMPDIVDQIAASIAPSIYGLDDVKRSVACMLFGGSRKYLPDGTALRGDIHMLLLGDPSTAKSQVLKFVERAAPIAIYTSGKGSSAAGLTAALVKDQHGNYALEGGAMVLADGGVVCIDEFDKMRDDDRVAIHEAMEQQTISIAKAGINTVLTTQCAVIAAANPTFGCYDDTKDTSEQHNFEATILSRFDCIWLVRDERNVEKDRVLASHIFSLYTSNKGGAQNSNCLGEGPIPLELLRQYMCYCRSHCHPRLSLDAAKALENFYVEVREKSRSDRRNRRNQIPITLRQLESLARLAEAFAKMSLSNQATLAHVEEAIRLFRVSTVATAQTSAAKQLLTPADREAVRACEEAILQRLAIGSRAAKTTIVRDMRIRGFEGPIIAKALTVLIQKGTLEERGDATVRRLTS